MSTAIMTREFFQKHGAAGGRKSAKNLTPEERSERVRKGWKKRKAKKKERQ